VFHSPVVEAGRPVDEEAVVFVHGNPGSSRDWEYLVAAVGQFGRAVALDMPGFGKADKPDDFDYTVPGCTRHPGGRLAEAGASTWWASAQRRCSEPCDSRDSWPWLRPAPRCLRAAARTDWLDSLSTWSMRIMRISAASAPA
jgi:pimeloyl-ACP methyl ester carboxylesterase